MKKIGRSWFMLVVILIIALTYLAFLGLRSPDGTVLIRGADDIRWGIDIKGGVSVSFGPETNIRGEISADEMSAVSRTIGLRFEDYGVSGYEIHTDRENRRVTVSFPLSGEAGQEAERIIGQLSATAHICAVEGRTNRYPIVTYYTDSQGHTIAVDSAGSRHRLALDSGEILSARRVRGEDGSAAVVLTFTDEGRQLFLESTGRLTAYAEHSDDRYMTFCIDGTPISELYVTGAMTGATLSPAAGLSEEDADSLVSLINNGELAVPLQIMDYEQIDPTLGRDPVRVMVWAGAAAYIIISLFMIFRYRLPGAVAAIALLGQISGSIAAVTGFFPFFEGFTLTLPGVAGMILSIGMGVDANIITAERIAEEIRKGKTIDGALAAGSQNSFSSIFDGNITVIAVAVILMGVFGPPDTLWSYMLKPVTWMFPVSTVGSVYSFGYTLLVGVIFNFIMGVTASRIMLRSLSVHPALRSRKLYGGVEA